MISPIIKSKKVIVLLCVLFVVILSSIMGIYHYQKTTSFANQDRQVIIDICQWAEIDSSFLALQQKISLHYKGYMPRNPSMMQVNRKFPQTFIYYWKSKPINSIYCKITVNKDFMITDKHYHDR